MEAQTKFKAKYKLNFPLLADTEFEVIEAYDARRMKSFFGKSFLGIVRMTFWIGPDGNIRKIWDKVTPRGHAAEVLAAVQRRLKCARAVTRKETPRRPRSASFSMSALSISRVSADTRRNQHVAGFAQAHHRFERLRIHNLRIINRHSWFAHRARAA